MTASDPWQLAGAGVSMEMDIATSIGNHDIWPANFEFKSDGAKIRYCTCVQFTLFPRFCCHQKEGYISLYAPCIKLELLF